MTILDFKRVGFEEGYFTFKDGFIAEMQRLTKLFQEGIQAGTFQKDQDHLIPMMESAISKRFGLKVKLFVDKDLISSIPFTVKMLSELHARIYQGKINSRTGFDPDKEFSKYNGTVDLKKKFVTGYYQSDASSLYVNFEQLFGKGVSTDEVVGMIVHQIASLFKAFLGLEVMKALCESMRDIAEFLKEGKDDAKSLLTLLQKANPNAKQEDAVTLLNAGSATQGYHLIKFYSAAMNYQTDRLNKGTDLDGFEAEFTNDFQVARFAVTGFDRIGQAHAGQVDPVAMLMAIFLYILVSIVMSLIFHLLAVMPWPLTILALIAMAIAVQMYYNGSNVKAFSVKDVRGVITQSLGKLRDNMSANKYSKEDNEMLESLKSSLEKFSATSLSVVSSIPGVDAVTEFFKPGTKGSVEKAREADFLNNLQSSALFQAGSNFKLFASN